jgi:hypothetical protein
LEDLRKRNAKIEEINKKRWEEFQKKKEEDYLKEHRKRKGGPRPAWKHTEEWGAIVRKKGRGAIDWYRYQEVILKKLLLPFAYALKLKTQN